MQIQLKQTEIEKAIKAFISNQGINLVGKSVEIAFTSGRKDNGLSAEINIEDGEIPGFTDSDEVDRPVAKKLTAVPSPSKPKPEGNIATVEDTIAVPEDADEIQQEESIAVKPPSLFS